ncbi:TonB-dependent receptor [Cellvibrio sp. UBA7671]|uniref:TonB-dependent receptor n=1 Tax=Cellvibrio sp. UBA7671 TaxID=1946312 RepID=UPI002F35086E
MSSSNFWWDLIYQKIARTSALFILSLLSIFFSTTSQAVEFNIPSQPLSEALITFSSQSGYAVFSSSEILAEQQSLVLNGSYEPTVALKILLTNTDLDFEFIDSKSILITKKSFNKEIPLPAQLHSDLLQKPSSVVEEIVVSGMRWSLKNSLSEKRIERSVSDVISSENLGKFPDANIVESLQRMTGVAITRTRGGEGQFFTVRGLGQQFNKVSLNGQEVATDNIGREFSFDILPAELISEVKVIKSPQASHDEGAIGGSVLIKTPRPLDESFMRSEIAFGKGYDTLSGHSGDKISGVFSNMYADDKLGVLISASYARRNWRSDMAQSLGSGFSNAGDEIDIDNDGAYDVGLHRPFFTAYPVKWGERERLGVVGTIEYQWNESLLSSLDVFYGEYSTPEDASYQTNNFFYKFKPGSVTVDEHKTITHFVIENYQTEIGADPKNRIVDTNQVIWATDWQASELLSVHTDIGYSEANRPEGGKTKFWVARIPGATVEYTAKVPVPEVKVTMLDGRDISEVNNNEVYPGFMETKGDDISDKTVTFHIDFNLDLNWPMLESIEAGIYGQWQSKDRYSYLNSDPQAYQYTKYSFAHLGVTGNRNIFFENFLNDIDGEFQRTWPHIDVDAVYEALQAADGVNYPEGYSNGILPALNPRGSSLIDEDKYAFYVQTNFSGNKWEGNVGGRLIITDLESQGYPQELIGIEFIDATSNYRIITGDPTSLVVNRGYVNFLPSANINFDIYNDVVLRMALAKTMARPSLAQLGVDVQYEVNEGELRLSRIGNPYLNPIVSNQFDVSTEWYISDTSFASAVIFYKKISGFVSNGVSQETILGKEFTVTQPVNNKKADIVGAELSYQYLWDNGFGFHINSSYTDSYIDAENVLVESGLENLSKISYNLIGIYEKHKWSARLALNYRDQYIQSLVGQGFRPEIVDEYSQLDFNASYALTPNLSIYVEGVNILDEPRFVYSEYKNRFIEYEQTGARYYLGFRLAI